LSFSVAFYPRAVRFVYLADTNTNRRLRDINI